MSGLTQSLARFTADPGFHSVPEEAARIVMTGFIDTVATLLAGRNEPVVGILTQFVAAKKSAVREAHFLFGTGMAASADAALINATAGHALDYDDVAIGGHPSVVLVPAVLAEGEALNASGADVLRAYLVGYEVWAELFAREPDAYHLKGWHPTGVFGTVGAAAAVAHLHKLPAGVCRHALALAASMASGLVANFGTMTKPLHAGRAAANAIEAVRLAAAGLTASPDAIEHNVGFLAALSPQGRVDRTGPAAELGKRLRILEAGLSIKKYPMCYGAHRVIDAMLDMVTAHDIQPANVKEIRACIGIAQASMLRNHAPVTGLEAKFSLEFAAACALVERKVGLRQLTDACVAQSGVVEAMGKVKISTVTTHLPHESSMALADSVAIELEDGRVLESGEIRFARGNAKLPLGEAELKAKFVDCAGPSAALYERLQGLAGAPSVRALMS